MLDLISGGYNPHDIAVDPEKGYDLCRSELIQSSTSIYVELQ